MFPIHAMPLTLGSPGGTGAVLCASAPGCCAGAKRSRAVAWGSATRGPWDDFGEKCWENSGETTHHFFYGFLWEFAVILEELNGISLGYHHHWGYGD